MNKKKYILVVSLLGVGFLFYFLFSSSEEDILSKNKDIAKNSHGITNSDKTSSPQVLSDKDKSLFESEFLNQDGFIFEDDESLYQNKNKKSVDTWDYYSEQSMKQFAKLREVMPNNSLIPRRLTKEEKEKKLKHLQKIRNISFLLDDKLATREEAKLYFNHVEKRLEDQKELANHILKMYEKANIAEEKNQKIIEEKLEVFKKLLTRIEVRKKEANKKHKDYLQSLEE